MDPPLRGPLESILEGAVAAGFANEVLEQVVVHVCKGLGLSDGREVVDAELEAELLQVLKMKRPVWSLPGGLLARTEGPSV